MNTFIVDSWSVKSFSFFIGSLLLSFTVRVFLSFLRAIEFSGKKVCTSSFGRCFIDGMLDGQKIP